VWGQVVNESSPGLCRIEAVVLVGAVVVAGLGGVVWAGAALAALLSGGHLPGDLVDAIRAAVELPEHVDDPRLAWSSSPGRAALPDAGVYWASTIAVLVVVLGLVWLGVRWWSAARVRGRVRLGVETRARFATVHDLASLIVSGEVPSGRFVLGQVHGRLVATEDRHTIEAGPVLRRLGRRVRRGDRGSVAVIGPSRSGKTANVIAGLLEWDGPR
jgi:type IV secretion system protein VirD4